MKRLLLPFIAASALATGCVAHGDVGGSYSYGYATTGPDLYYLGPGVSVVAYSEYPTFYSDNYYWMYSGGAWYRSSYYGGGWVVSYDVPMHVRSIRNPYGYTRFQPGTGWTRTGSARVGGSYNPRGYRPNGRASSAPPPAYAPRGGAPRGTYQAPAARKSGGSYNPPPPRGGSGYKVRDHRRR